MNTYSFIFLTLSIGYMSVTAVDDIDNSYMGFDVTSNEEDVALCGKDIWGCVSAPTSTRRCDNHAELGAWNDMGSAYQTWNYDAGLLRSNLPAVDADAWLLFEGVSSSPTERCLGLDSRAIGEYYVPGKSYSVGLRHCQEEDSKQRWLFVNGRVQNLGPVANASEWTFPFCMAIDQDSIALESSIEDTLTRNDATGSRIVLKQCDETDPQQAIDPYGRVEPFLHSFQQEYGREDTIQIAYLTPPDTTTEINIYSFLDDGGSGPKIDPSDPSAVQYFLPDSQEPIYTKTTSAASCVLTLDAADLLGSTPQGEGGYSNSYRTTAFVVEFEGSNYQVAFDIAPQPHVSCTSGYGTGAGSAAVVALLSSVAVVGAIVITVVLLARDTGTASANNIPRVTTDSEDDMAAGKHTPDERSDDATQASGEEESTSVETDV